LQGPPPAGLRIKDDFSTARRHGSERTASWSTRRDSVSKEEIEKKVIDIVSEQLQVDKAELSLEKSFLGDLKADSLDLVELVMEFEDEFKISIPDEDYEKIKTIGNAVEYIISHQA
jgi:acyl carrier protein